MVQFLIDLPLNQLVFVIYLTEPKVGQFNHVIMKQYIAWLYISVKDVIFI